MTEQDRKAIMIAMVAVLCWSTVATAFKLALAEQSLYQLLWVANISTLVVLAAVLVFRGQLLTAFKTLNHRFGLILILGLLNPVAYYLVLFQAYDLLPAQVAQPINYTWAITLSLLAIPYLGHKFSRRDGISMLMAYSGVVFISFGGQASGQDISLWGIALALGSTLLWAAYWLLNTKDQRDPVLAIFQNFLVALPFTTFIFYQFDGHFQSSWPSLLSGIYVGFFEMGITFVFWLTAMRMASRASIVSNLIFISPFLSLILIATILGETIGALTIVGLVAIVIALLYQNAGKKAASET